MSDRALAIVTDAAVLITTPGPTILHSASKKRKILKYYGRIITLNLENLNELVRRQGLAMGNFKAEVTFLRRLTLCLEDTLLCHGLY